ERARLLDGVTSRVHRGSCDGQLRVHREGPLAVPGRADGVEAAGDRITGDGHALDLAFCRRDRDSLGRIDVLAACRRADAQPGVRLGRVRLATGPVARSATAAVTTRRRVR